MLKGEQVANALELSEEVTTVQGMFSEEQTLSFDAFNPDPVQDFNMARMQNFNGNTIAKIENPYMDGQMPAGDVGYADAEWPESTPQDGTDAAAQVYTEHFDSDIL